MVVEGDSISQGHNTTTPATINFGYLLSQKSFGAAMLAYYNVAATGTYVATAVSRYAAFVYPYRPTANGGTGGPKTYLFLMIGINDLRAGTSGSSVISAINAYTAQARTDGFTVVLGAILPDDDASSGGYEDDRRAVNDAIRSGAIASDIVYDGAWVLSNASDTAIFPDKLHPSEIAHQMLAAYLNAGLSGQGFKFSYVPNSGVSDYKSASVASGSAVSMANGGAKFRQTGLHRSWSA